MKSQDILLMLKLISLAQRQNGGLLHSVSPEALEPVWHELDALADAPAGSVAEADDIYSAYSLRGLALLTGIGKSEVSNALARCCFSGLARPGRNGTPPSVNTKALLEFLVYGIRFVFPVKMEQTVRGIPTCLLAPIFGGVLHAADSVPVWPYAKGSVAGPAIEPLYKTVAVAINGDPGLYAMLALVDSIRVGLPRERNLAVKKLEILLRS